jgi:alpha-galactosidase
MRGLRTIPVLLAMCADMEELCPDVWFLNYTNPMAINCRAINRASRIRTVGLCHSVQGTAFELSIDLGIPYGEIDYLAAGINHMAFYLKFERDGVDLYPRLRALAQSGDIPDDNRVRYEVLRRLGYFVTESSEHFAEYVPWFIKHDRPDLIERFNIPLDEYPRRCVAQIASWESERDRLEGAGVIEVQPSFEYAATIIRSIETGKPRVIYGNVANDGLIDDLPTNCTVEVPCLVDGNGIQPTRIGALPPQVAALIRTNINVQELTVEAALTGRIEHIYHAAMLDPHTAAELDLDQITALVDALLLEHGTWIPR